MLEAILVIVGLAVGAIVAGTIVRGRVRLTAERESRELQATVASNESRLAEVREQLTQKEQSEATLRSELDAARQARTESETRLQESSKRFTEQQRLLSEAEKKLKETFEALSASALKSNAEQFLLTAKKTLDTVLADARGDMGKREEAIKGLVKPIAESLKRYEVQIQSLEQARQKAYGSMSEQLRTLGTASQLLQKETGRLVSALRDPKVRGRWGELALKRSAELAGMVDHCDFEQQVSVDSDDGRFRPDMVVHLPGGRIVVVDAKAVLDAYLDAVAATDEDTRNACLARHASQVRSRIKELSSKSYWDKLDSSPEFVVLFLPGESFFSAAVEVDAKLIEDAMDDRVVLASPTTFIALLRAIAFGWRQEQIAENAEKISALGKDLFERIRSMVEHLDKVGSNLNRAVGSFNKAVGSLESRVLPSARRFRELGAAGGDDIAELEAIDTTARSIEAFRNSERKELE